MAPSITNIAPASGSLLSADWQLARRTPVVFELTVDAGYVPVVRVKYGDNPHAWPVVYDGGKFAALFALDSTIESVGDVHTFTIVPRGGWWRGFQLIPGQATIADSGIIHLAGTATIGAVTATADLTVASGAPSPTGQVDWQPATLVSINPSSNADALYDFQEAAGDFVDQIGAEDLANVGGTSHWQDRTAPGISDGSDLSSVKCAEWGESASSSDRYEAAGTSFMQASAQSVAVRLVLRGRKHSAGYKALLGHRQISANGGWHLQIAPDSGQPNLVVYDGTNFVQVAVAADHLDGGWHCVEAIVDWTAGTARVRSDLGSGSISLSTISQAGVVGSKFSIGGTGHQSPVAFQALRVGCWQGASAEGLDAEALSSWWTHGADPNAGTAFEDTSISYTGTVWAPVADGLFAPWSGDAGQLPIGYDTRLSARGAPNDFGRWLMGSYTNLCTESERIDASGTVTNATVSAAAADLVANVRGFTGARKLTASANDGYYETAAIAVTNGNTHQAYVWVAGSGGTVTGRLVAYDATGAAETASQVFSAPDGAWTLVKLSFVAASTSYTLRVEVDTSGEAVYVCSLTLIDSATKGPAHWGAPIPTYGAAATIDNTDGRATLASEDWNEAAFTLDMFFVPGSNDGFRKLPQLLGAGDHVDMRLRNNNSALQMQAHTDGANSAIPGAAVTHALATDWEDGVRLRFYADSANPIAAGVYSRIVVDDGAGELSGDFATAAWTPGDGVNGLTYGISLSPLNGLLGHIDIYDVAEAV